MLKWSKLLTGREWKETGLELETNTTGSHCSLTHDTTKSKRPADQKKKDWIYASILTEYSSALKRRALGSEGLWFGNWKTLCRYQVSSHKAYGTGHSLRKCNSVWSRKMEAAAGFAHLEKKGENKKESKTLDVDKNDGDTGLVREKRYLQLTLI